MYFPMFFDRLCDFDSCTTFGCMGPNQSAGTFNQFSRVYSRKGVRAYEAARVLLDRFGLSNVPIENFRFAYGSLRSENQGPTSI